MITGYASYQRDEDIHDQLFASLIISDDEQPLTTTSVSNTRALIDDMLPIAQIGWIYTARTVWILALWTVWIFTAQGSG